jgi:creatinine amidohydrolase/Fe(II)-dependent formamide hydrolase-like protein
VDCFRNERLGRELAHAIAQRPDWHVLAFPFIPLGQGGFEELGAKAGLHPVFTVTSATLQRIHMDLADRLGEQGYRWVFVINSHGSPYHLRAIDQAGDYFHDTYQGHMVHLTGLLGLDDPTDSARSTLNATERDEDGLGFHAGMRETSEALFLRPDLVDPAYKQALPVTVRNESDIARVSASEDWPGYFGSPRLGVASVGESVLKDYSARLNKLALEILDGKDYRQMARPADEALKGLPDVPEHERTLARKQEDWQKRKQSPKGSTR